MSFIGALVEITALLRDGKGLTDREKKILSLAESGFRCYDESLLGELTQVYDSVKEKGTEESLFRALQEIERGSRESVRRAARIMNGPDPSGAAATGNPQGGSVILSLEELDITVGKLNALSGMMVFSCEEEGDQIRFIGYILCDLARQFREHLDIVNNGPPLAEYDNKEEYDG